MTFLSAKTSVHGSDIRVSTRALPFLQIVKLETNIDNKSLKMNRKCVKKNSFDCKFCNIQYFEEIILSSKPLFQIAVMKHRDSSYLAIPTC
jgi:hypothetical protein